MGYAYLLSHVQLCDHMDCGPPGSSVHGDSPGKNIGVVAMLSSRGSSQPRDRTQVFHIAGRFFTIQTTREAQEYWSGWPIPSPGDCPDSGIKPGSPALQVDSLPVELPGKTLLYYIQNIVNIALIGTIYRIRNSKHDTKQEEYSKMKRSC